MKRGAVVFCIAFVLIIAFFYFAPSGFGPDYSKAEIKQAIGGVLICNAVHTADLHSWQFDVNYKYKDVNDSLYDIGNGTYYGREWKKDEQLIKFGRWVILKTGAWIRTDKIIIGDCNTRKWTEYEFSPDSIEKEDIWISSDIHSLTNCCSETFINSIHNGQIDVIYKFRVDEHHPKRYGKRKLIYKIALETGKPVLSKIISNKI